MSRELRAAMMRHPAGRNLRHKRTTIYPLYAVPSESTATADASISEKGTNHND